MPNSGKSLAILVGSNIMARRKRRNMTQEQLAELVGIGQQSLSRMEKGHISPRFDRLQRFADVLGCPVADLFRVDGSEGEASINDLIRPLSEDSRATVINVVTEITRAMLRLEVPARKA